MQVLESQVGGDGPKEVERVRGLLQTLLFCEEAFVEGGSARALC